jgi:4-hydroxy-tetrahydrodipicolinate synthase
VSHIKVLCLNIGDLKFYVRVELFVPYGIIPALPTPFKNNLEIDEHQLRNLIDWIIDIDGVKALLLNGEVGEVSSLSLEERKRTIEIAVNEAGEQTPIIAGIRGGAVWDTVEQLKIAKSLGAKAALVMIPYSILFGFSEAHILYFYKQISNAVDFPLIIYQHPRPNNYSPKLLQELAKIENIVGIKDVSWDFETCREDFEALDTADRKISKLTGNDTILLSVFSLGIDGALLGFAALVPEKVYELFIAVKNGDLIKAKNINNKIEKFANLIFGEPACQNSVRIKEGLVMRNVLNNSHARPPLLPLDDTERNQIRKYLEILDLFHK